MPTKTYEKQIESAKKRVEKSFEEGKISEKDRDLIMEFDRYQVLNDYSDSRRYKYLTNLRQMGEVLDVPFNETERKDIEGIILWMKKRNLSDATIYTKKCLLKRFYRWINDDKGYPECVDWINTGNGNGKKKLPNEILTEEDINSLLDACNNSRNRALISLLWETGARIGELIDLTINDLKNHKYGLQIVVDGKTGERRIPLIESVPHLNNWLMDHPDRDNPKAPLWVNVGGANSGKKIGYRTILKMLNSTANRGDVDKPVNPHQFRHSRATYLASRFTEAQLCEWFGWVQGSDVPAQYVHMSGRDIDSSYARLHGIEDEENPEVTKMAPKDCPRCGNKVPPEADFCYRCGMALTIESSKEIKEDEEEMAEKFTEFAKEDPNILEDMQEFMGMMKFFKKNKGMMEDFQRFMKEENS